MWTIAALAVAAWEEGGGGGGGAAFIFFSFRYFQFLLLFLH